MSDSKDKDKSGKASPKEKKKQTGQVDMGHFEEDDEFEEFPVEDWTRDEESKGESHMWEDNWDDDKVESPFNAQLRASLQKFKTGN